MKYKGGNKSETGKENDDYNGKIQDQKGIGLVVI
jgi:hypothetical protein